MFSCSTASLLLLLNQTNSILLKQCAQNRFVEIRYGISLTENGGFYVEIEENEVCVGQAYPEIESRKYRFLCSMESLLLLFNTTNGILIQQCEQNICVKCDRW